MEITKTQYIDWMYPNIYPEKDLDSITISLNHVRAADAITIEYDGDRDGWVIRMDKTKDMGGYSEVVEEKQEVAFISSWNEDADSQE